MNVTENVNQSANQTGNSSFWQPFNPKGLPDFSNIIYDLENSTVSVLESWGFDATHFMFSVLLALLVVLVLYYFFVRITSSSSGIFKYVFYILIVFIILVGLDII